MQLELRDLGGFWCPGCEERKVKALCLRTMGAPDSEPPCTTLCSIDAAGRICCSHLDISAAVQE